MAIVNAQAKLYQGTYSSVVDVILLPSTLSSNFSISCIISRRVSYEANIQGNGSIAASTLGYQTKGGGNKTKDGFFIQNQRYKITSLGNTDWNDISGSSLTPTVGTEFTAIKSGDTTKTGQAMLSDWVARSTLVCQFPTYVRIDVDKLMLPEGTDVRLELEEGFVIEGDYFESKRSPLSKNTNLITFRTPKRFYSQILASQYSLGAVTGFKRFAQSNTNSIASIVARITYNPGKFASLVVTNFANTTVARKTVRPTSVMSSQFTFPIGNFRARLFDSTFVTSPFTLTQPSQNARVRFGVASFASQTVQQTEATKFLGLIDNFTITATTSQTARKIVDPVISLGNAMTANLSAQITRNGDIDLYSTTNLSVPAIDNYPFVYQYSVNPADILGGPVNLTFTGYGDKVLINGLLNGGSKSDDPGGMYLYDMNGNQVATHTGFGVRADFNSDIVSYDDIYPTYDRIRVFNTNFNALRTYNSFPNGLLSPGQGGISLSSSGTVLAQANETYNNGSIVYSINCLLKITSNGTQSVIRHPQVNTIGEHSFNNLLKSNNYITFAVYAYSTNQTMIYTKEGTLHKQLNDSLFVANTFTSKITDNYMLRTQGGWFGGGTNYAYLYDFNGNLVRTFTFTGVPLSQQISSTYLDDTYAYFTVRNRLEVVRLSDGVTIQRITDTSTPEVLGAHTYGGITYIYAKVGSIIKVYKKIY